MNDDIELLARLEAAEQKAAQLEALLASYEKSQTLPPPSGTTLEQRVRNIEQWMEFNVVRFDELDGKLDTVITKFEAHSSIMERVERALREPPQCADCPLRKTQVPHLSLAPVAAEGE